MERYVIENKSNKISLLRPHDRMSVQIRLAPGDIYTDIYNLDENDINYYRQLAKSGLHLMKYADYLRKEGRKNELKKYLAENEVDLEENPELSLEEEGKNEDTKEEDKKVEEEDITEQSLKEMSEEDVRDLGEKLGVGNYWNKNLDTLSKDILSELQD